MTMDWPYKSQRDLIDAGFRFRGFVPCPVCGTQVGTYPQLDHFPEFLDTETFERHIGRYKHADLPEPDRKMAAAGDT